MINNRNSRMAYAETIALRVMNDTLQPILTDSSDFPEMRRKGCVYVDKTAYFHKLLLGPDSRFFIARPRRFGKSLMISTFKAIFEAVHPLLFSVRVFAEPACPSACRPGASCFRGFGRGQCPSGRSHTH